VFCLCSVQWQTSRCCCMPRDTTHTLCSSAAGICVSRNPLPAASQWIWGVGASGPAAAASAPPVMRLIKFMAPPGSAAC
jgi:hypothetical protein